MNEIDKAIDWLKSSPMQRMSLGSRELFHSDFLAWLFETYPAALKPVFGIELTNCVAEREKYNLDLVIRESKQADPVIIIENKVKNYPDKLQLNRYAQKFLKVNKRVLLTLMEPSFNPKNLKLPWEIIRYCELSKALKKWATSTNIASNHSQYIFDYIALTGNLSIVAREYFDSVQIEKSDFWFRDDQANHLMEIGFTQSYRKLQAQTFLSAMVKRVQRFAKDKGLLFTFCDEDMPEGSPDYVIVRWDLFNNTPCATFVPKLGSGHNDTGFEIQLQGTQYRRLTYSNVYRDFVGVRRTEEEAYNRLWSAIDKNGGRRWLIDRELKKDKRGKYFLVGGARRSTSMRGNLCQYKPNVVYQYINISADGMEDTLALSDLPSEICNDLGLAFSLLKEKMGVATSKTEQ